MDSGGVAAGAFGISFSRKEMARPVRLERTTLGSASRCSIQLSYGRAGFLRVGSKLRLGPWASARLLPTNTSSDQPGGESGIRTHGRLPHTRFPSVRLRPLGHLSGNLRDLDGCPAATREATATSGRAIPEPRSNPHGPPRPPSSRPWKPFSQFTRTPPWRALEANRVESGHATSGRAGWLGSKRDL